LGWVNSSTHKQLLFLAVFVASHPFPQKDAEMDGAP